jgi:Skp family chaperone for outer membrane proteins
MKCHTPILLSLFVLLSGSLFAQNLKIATVSMERLFNDYDLTAEIQREINIERARIQKENNQKLADIRSIDKQLQEIREQLDNEELDLGEKKKAELMKEMSELSQDGIHKERERTEYLERLNNSLNEKMKRQMRGILETIKRAVEERAKSGNYDYIFDASGNSKQGIPFVIHARETTDLTDSLLDELNKVSE